MSVKLANQVVVKRCTCVSSYLINLLIQTCKTAESICNAADCDADESANGTNDFGF